MRIFPEICPRTTWPFSSLTRNVALGRVSAISPCICIVSSFAISPCRKCAATLEIRFLEQAFVLVAHGIGLHLRHEIHGHYDDDEERGAAEIKGHVFPDDQEFRHQANQDY